MTLHDRVSPPPVDMAEVVRITAETVEAMVNEGGDPGMAQNWARMKNGETPAQIMGLTRQELEALFAHGYSLISQKKTNQAQVIFTQLVQLDPLEAKYRYCLGLCYQLENDIDAAARLYLEFLALDATNFDGYMRLGECHLAVGEPDMAKSYFETAIAHAEEQTDVPGAVQALSIAREQINQIQER